MEETSQKTDQNVEYAKERTFFASENTLMAWIRTSMTLIGFGIGIFETLEKSVGKPTFKSSKLVGLSMVILGIIALVLAIIQRRNTNQTLLQSQFRYTRDRSLAVGIALGLMFIGVWGIIQILANLMD